MNERLLAVAGSKGWRIGRVELIWCLYDWANSAFATSVLGTFLPVHFARHVVPASALELAFRRWSWHIEAPSLWAYTVSLALFIVALSAPLLGAVADHRGRRKTFFLAFAAMGSLATCALYGATAGRVGFTIFVFVLAHIGFSGSEVFYNAYLPVIAPPEKRDRLSGLGYAFGYVGGGLLLAIHLLFIRNHAAWGIPTVDGAVRLAFVSVGLWWAVFTLPSLFLPSEETPPRLPLRRILSGAVRDLNDTIRDTRRNRHRFLFILSYFSYNNGIQTVISMASIYGATELGLSLQTLLGAFLLTQWIAFPGAVFVARSAERWGTRRVLFMTLCLWCAIVVYAYRMTCAWEFWILAGFVGFILGGSQSLSRSLYSQMIPADRSSKFFGFFAVGGKFSAILGPLCFGISRDLLGDSRRAILTVLIFFLVGMALLSRVRLADANAPLLQSKTLTSRDHGGPAPRRPGSLRE